MTIKRKIYELVLSDPPWNQNRGTHQLRVRPNSSGKPLDYPVMSLQDIEDIQKDIQKQCKDDHILFIWTIEKYLHETEIMLKKLDYKIHARMIWNKITGIPAAFTIRFGHEYLLYCYHGKLLKVDKKARGKIHSVFTELIKSHSTKPRKSYEIIESLYPDLKKLEMYARNKRYGWDSWGNEISTDIQIEGYSEQNIKAKRTTLFNL